MQTIKLSLMHLRKVHLALIIPVIEGKKQWCPRSEIHFHLALKTMVLLLGANLSPVCLSEVNIKYIFTL